jgi:hypothetical protein
MISAALALRAGPTAERVAPSGGLADHAGQLDQGEAVMGDPQRLNDHEQLEILGLLEAVSIDPSAMRAARALAELMRHLHSLGSALPLSCLTRIAAASYETWSCSTLASKQERKHGTVSRQPSMPAAKPLASTLS